MSEEAVPWVTVDIAGYSGFDWEDSRTAPVPGLVSVGSFVGWRLVEGPGRSAAHGDRN